MPVSRRRAARASSSPRRRSVITTSDSKTMLPTNPQSRGDEGCWPLTWARILPRRWPMRLIGLVVALAVSFILAPLAAEAQQPAEKVYRVGWIGAAPTTDPHLHAAFRLALSERGYDEGRNVIFERRYHGGQLQRYPELVADLVRLQVDTILVSGDQAIKAAKDATTTIPIVMGACDAGATGLISSLGRPGGKNTGGSCMDAEITGRA